MDEQRNSFDMANNVPEGNTNILNILGIEVAYESIENTVLKAILKQRVLGSAELKSRGEYNCCPNYACHNNYGEYYDKW